MDKRYFSSKIVQWYLHNKRDLPWRETADPYKIWLSEIILQQTRVSQGLPYYERFVERYPTVSSLAAANEQEVLRLWQGLGYYSRARNLHKCAKTVEKNFSGRFPQSFRELRQLAGIGDYTAAAVASIAFGEKAAVVDGNVFRVLSRLFGINTPVNSTAGKKIFNNLANELIQTTERPDLYNQALMEYGATFCTPVNPQCDNCFFRKSCVAFANNLQSELPIKLKKKKSRERFFTYIVFRKGRSLLMRQRTGKDIWRGLYDFPIVEASRPLKPGQVIKQTPWLRKRVKTEDVAAVSEPYRHILTHQTIFCTFIIIDHSDIPESTDKTLKFYSFSKIKQLPKPVLISRFLQNHAFLS